METEITGRAIADFQDAWQKLSDIAKFNIGQRGTGRTYALTECFGADNSMFVKNGGVIVVDSGKAAHMLMSERKCRAISIHAGIDTVFGPVIFDHFVIETAVASGLIALRSMKAAIDSLKFDNMKLEHTLDDLRTKAYERDKLIEDLKNQLQKAQAKLNDACTRNQGGVSSDSES